MNVLRFAGPFAFLAAIPILYHWSDFAPYGVPGAVLTALLVGSYLPEPKPAKSAASHLLPTLYILSQLAAVGWATHEACKAQTNTLAFFGLALAIGVCTGVFGVLAAHEMIHSRTRWHRWLGTAMLTVMTYRHFRIAHIYGHHRHAATKHDVSTARLNESFYAFLIRTVPGQLAEAWRFEQRRLRNAVFFFLRNGVNRDIAISIALYVGLWIGIGLRAAAFLGIESMVAILVLELFNYVAHYGLLRKPGETLRPQHSWNSPGAANLLIFNMGRHSHHHHAPARAYDGLTSAARAPRLPGGYAGAILLALVPPLWRAVIHPRLNNVAAEVRESVYAGASHPVAATP